MRRGCATAGLRGAGALLALVLPACAPAQPSPAAPPSPSLALDHVPVAVRRLDDARRTYERLGFRLKPGRLHPNGLHNAFAKLADGAYLELISPERGAADALAGEYAAFLAGGEGGAFLALAADSLARLSRRLDAAGAPGELRSYPGAFATRAFADTALAWLFLIEYLAPVADPPGVLDHPNTAVGMETVWLAEASHASLGPLRDLLPAGRVRPSTAAGPPRAPVLGVTLRVRSADSARAAVRSGTGLDLPLRRDARGRSVRVPASHAHGIWIELLEPRPPSPAPRP
ncbi:MAG TPA: VOC family protein [Longimicrobiaceae bacterium]|nr:VOC family protein [Longimicrobiaceae bacterium]